jgi:hypothetical protein
VKLFLPNIFQNGSNSTREATSRNPFSQPEPCTLLLSFGVPFIRQHSHPAWIMDRGASLTE